MRSRLRNDLNDEHGFGLIPVMFGVIMIAFLGLGLAINIPRYYELRSRLNQLASITASMGGMMLPDPKASCDRAKAAFGIFKNNFRLDPDSGAVSDYPSSLAIKIYIQHYASTVVANNPEASLTKTLVYDSKDTVHYDCTMTNITLPVKSLITKTTATYSAGLFDPLGKSGGGLANVNASSEASAELAPTDVVLVVENSNSVLSPLATEQDTLFSSNTHPFFGWGSETVGAGSASYRSTAQLGGTVISEVSTMTRALAYSRQCVGSTWRNIKTAALATYDLLTASSSFRVGVIFTRNAGSEFNELDIPIEQGSYANAYLQDANWLPTPDTEEGSVDHPETRCVALTSVGGSGDWATNGSRIPTHPMASSVGVAWGSSILRTDISSLLNNSGAYDSSATDLTWLDFTTDAKMTPRELIWSKPAGMLSASGMPNPKYDQSYTQYALLRALDALRQADPRVDQVPVSRKVILAFVDGFEDPYASTASIGNQSPAVDFSFHRVKDFPIPAASPTPNTYVANTSWTTATDSSVLFPRYCKVAANNANEIFEESKVNSTLDANSSGIKLGVLAFTKKTFTCSGSDPDLYCPLQALPGHASADATNYRTECNSKWAGTRGRFLVETGSSDTASDYYNKVAPQVARALMVPEISGVKSVN